MSGHDDSFFGPGGGRPPAAQLYIRSRITHSDPPDVPSSDMDTTADATFFGATRHRQPALHNLSTALDDEGVDVDEGIDIDEAVDAEFAQSLAVPLTPVSRAQLEAYRQQVRQEARPDFASSIGESYADEEYAAEDYVDSEAYEGEHQEEYDEEEEEGDEEEEEEEGEEADESYPESEGSSAAFDPDNDPVGFAERLDELAGVLEMGEAEARALRWGPAMGRGNHGKFNQSCLGKSVCAAPAPPGEPYGAR